MLSFIFTIACTLGLHAYQPQHVILPEPRSGGSIRNKGTT